MCVCVWFGFAALSSGYSSSTDEYTRGPTTRDGNECLTSTFEPFNTLTMRILATPECYESATF